MSLVCEDLATKAELQELKAQINAVLGKTTTGSVIDVLAQGSLVGTEIESYQIEDIQVNEASFATGGAVGAVFLLKNAEVKSLPTLGQFVGGTIAKTKSLAKTMFGFIGKFSGLLTLLLIAADTITTQAQLSQIYDRIDDFDKFDLKYTQDYTALMSKLMQGELNYEQALTEIEALKATNSQFASQNNELLLDISDLVTVVNNQQVSIESAQTAISDLITEYSSLRTDLENYVEQDSEEMQIVLNTLSEMEAQLTKDGQIITALTDQVDKLTSRVTRLQIRIEILEQDRLVLDATLSGFTQYVNDLSLDFAEFTTVTNARTTSLEATVLLLRQRVRTLEDNPSGGGGGITEQGLSNLADSQTNTLKLTNLLAGNPLPTADLSINPVDVLGFNNPFSDIFDSLFPQIDTTIGTPVDTQQLRTDLSTDFEATLASAGLIGIAPIIAGIFANTTSEKQKQNTTEAVCEQTQEGGCINQNIKNPLQGLMGSLGNKLDALDLALDFSQLAALGGLATFLTKAWSSVAFDKIFNAIGLILMFHNAYMLSNDVFETVDAMFQVLQEAIKPNGIDGEPISIGETLSDWLENTLKATLGAETYAEVVAKLVAANRIYQASANVLNAANELFESGRAVADLTAENVGKIGNALVKAGVVYDNAYETMDERINAVSARSKAFESFRETLEGIEETSSVITEIAENVISTKDAYTELTGNLDEWDTARTEAQNVLLADRETDKTDSTINGDITANDFDKGEVSDS